MSYLGTGNEFAGFDSYVDYINNSAIQIRTNNTGTESVSVYKINAGALTKVFSQGETYYIYDYTAMNTMSDVLIMDPIAVGTTWTLGSGDQRSITAVNTAVTVPYGTFTDALEVTTTYADSVVKEYYAPGTGLIKRDFIPNGDPSNPITSALQVVEEGSAFTQTIRFYFPDFNDGIAYVDLSIDFHTGDDAAAKFETEFKNVAADSGLARVMKEGSSIRSITLDTNTNVVTVDLTKEFITEMNAGTSYEGRILECVADTLGGYFLTDKVQITIEGGPYESGHFLFNPGDYLPYDPESAYARP
jgi:hypothetical protein